jgi:hypothetical protein
MPVVAPPPGTNGLPDSLGAGGSSLASSASGWQALVDPGASRDEYGMTRQLDSEGTQS